MTPFFERRDAGRGGPSGGKAPPPSGVRPELSSGERVWGLVISRFNAEITEALEAGARSCLLAHGADDNAVLSFHVPGAFEIPAAARAILDGDRIDGLIALGCVIQGGTPHFEYVCRAVTDGIARLAYESNRPVSFGVLTVQTAEQARARAGGARGNKGWEAALAALEMAALLDRLAEAPRVGFRSAAP